MQTKAASVLDHIEGLTQQLPCLLSVAASQRRRGGDGGPRAAIGADGAEATLRGASTGALLLELQRRLASEVQPLAETAMIRLRRELLAKRRAINAMFEKTCSYRYFLRAVVIYQGGNPRRLGRRSASSPGGTAAAAASSAATAASGGGSGGATAPAVSGGSSHYYTYVRDGETLWTKLDDHRVTRGVDFSRVAREGFGGQGAASHATLLFYERVPRSRGDAEGSGVQAPAGSADGALRAPPPPPLSHSLRRRVAAHDARILRRFVEPMGPEEKLLRTFGHESLIAQGVLQEVTSRDVVSAKGETWYYAATHEEEETWKRAQYVTQVRAAVSAMGMTIEQYSFLLSQQFG
jgi:hypothetical protein